MEKGPHHAVGDPSPSSMYIIIVYLFRGCLHVYLS